MANESGSWPASSTSPTSSGPAPLLVSVKTCGADGALPGVASAKRRVTGESDAAGWTAVPASVTGTGP